MEAVAKTKYLKGSPRKARLVIDLIRGENVSRALSILRFTNKRAADPIAQCLNSAIANATYKAEQQNIAIDPDDLWVKTCYVDMGPTKNRRRMRPAPQGRAYREQRHYCHITIEVSSEDQPKSEKELRAEAAKARRAEARNADAGKPAKKTKSSTAPVNDTAADPIQTAAPAGDAASAGDNAPDVDTPMPTADDAAVPTEGDAMTGNDADTQTGDESAEAASADVKENPNAKTERQ
jgi:large subunit ribosomal protein L22